MNLVKKAIENKKKRDIINVSIDTFSEDEVLEVSEVIKICRNIKDERIEIDNEYYKNLEFIHKYGYTDDNIRKVIGNLTVFDLNKGPVADRNPKYKHPFWIFIKYLPDLQIKVYIKLKIESHKLKVNVFRFHKEGMFDESE